MHFFSGLLTRRGPLRRAIILDQAGRNHIGMFDNLSNFLFGMKMAEMRDFSLLAAQVRAARGLLGWTQGYLAEGVGVSRPTIMDFESGKREPHPATLSVLMSELAAAGIVFTERGVEFRKWPARPYVPTGIKQKMPRPVRLEKAVGTRKTIKKLTLVPTKR
jgi:transcriptional regulator with XRE-family HTH domain